MDDATNAVLLIILQRLGKDAKITKSAIEYLSCFSACYFRALLRPLADPENPRLSFLQNAAVALKNERFRLSEARLAVTEGKSTTYEAVAPPISQKPRLPNLNAAAKPVFVNLAHCHRPVHQYTSQAKLAALIHSQVDFSKPLEPAIYEIETTGACITAANALYYSHEGYGDFLAKLVQRSPDYGK